MVQGKSAKRGMCNGFGRTSKRRTGLEERQKWENMSLEEHLAIYEKEGMSRKDAMKQVAKDRGIRKRDVYQALLNQE